MIIIYSESFQRLMLISRETDAEMEKEGKEWPDYDPNPWAVCTDQVGRENKDKYERCVHHIKEKATTK